MFASRVLRSRFSRLAVLLAVVGSGVVPLASPWLASSAGAAPVDSTQLISVAYNGALGNDNAQGNFSMSADGRYIAFDSWASNLLPTGDGNATADIFVRDWVSGTTERVSVSNSGAEANGENRDPSISADGRYVAFTSMASNLTSDTDTNGTWDVFVRDRVAGTTELISKSLTGNATGNGQSGYGPRISPDGRYVVFGSDATNLFSGDTNGSTDVFLRDRTFGTTEVISISSGGLQGNSQSGWPSVSADGRYVAFMSGASTLVSGDTNANWDVFVRDRTAHTTERVSVADSTGAQGDLGSALPTMSGDGRYVTFYSSATNLVTGDTNNFQDVFVRDRTAGTTQRVSVGMAGQGNGDSFDPNISRDGRFIAFTSMANNFVNPSDDHNGSKDVFIFDRTRGGAERVSLATTGTEGNADSAGRADMVTADGRFIAFTSAASNLVAGDTNAKVDIFLRERHPYQGSLVGGPVPAGLWRGGGSPSTLLECSAPEGQPCDVDGNFFETTTDLTVPGRGVPLEFTRTYNAYPSPAAPADGPLGYGWSFSYGMSLTTGTNPTVTEENGAQVTFTGSANPYTAPSGVLATLVHNADGTWTFTRKAQEIYKFDSSGKLTAIQDLNGYSTTLTYNILSGLLSTVTDPAGRTLTMTWSGTHISKVTDTASPARSVTFTYTSNNLTDVLDVGGGHTQYGYDANHRMTTEREPKYYSDTTTVPVPVTTNHYDTSGRLDSQTDPLGRVTTFQYLGGQTEVTDPKGNVRFDDFTYGLLTGRTLGLNTPTESTWTYTYGPATLGLATTVDPNGDATTTVYDSAGNPTMTIDPLGRTTTRTFNALREPLTVRDPMDVTTTYVYDGAGNLQSESTPLVGSNPAVSKTTSYTLDTTAGRAGDVLSITDPDGKVWPRTWDSSGNLSTEADPLGNTTRYCYDTVGRKTREISPKGTAAGVTCTTSNPTYTTLITPDAFGDEIAVTDANGHTTQTSYDLNRNQATTTDALGAVTSYSYDPADQLIEQTNPWSVLARDDFTGTSGPWNPSLWGVTSGTTLVSNQGVLASGTTPARATAKTMADSLDSEATFSYQFSATGNSTLRVALRASGADKTSGADMPNAYRLEINPSTATVQLTKVVGGTVSNLGAAVSYSSGTTAQRVRFQVQGPVIRAKVWAATTSEPSTWTIERNDSSLTTGGVVQFSNLLVSGLFSQNVTIDDLLVLDAATPQGAAWTSPVRVADDFTGTSGAWNADRWGTTAAGVVISGNQGTLTANTANGTVRATTKAMADVADSEANLTYTLNSTLPTTTFQISLRSSGASKTGGVQMPTGYRLEITPSSTAVHIKKSVAGTVTDLGQFTYTQTANTAQNVRFQVQGSTIRAKIWTRGTNEPSAWSLSVTDSQITSPGVLQLVNAQAGSTASTVSIDDLSVMVANSLRWDYNADGTLFHAYDGAGQATTYGYDTQARLTTVTDELNRTTSYGYDPAGNRVTKADPAGTCPAWPITYPPTLSPTQKCTVSQYDAANQLAGMFYSDGTTPNVTMSYDLDGRRIKMTDGTGTSSWVWDSLGRLTSQTNGAGKTVGYGYDLRGNRTSIVYPGTTGTVTQTFDDASRMTKVTDWLSHQTVFNYDADSFMTSQVYPNGTTVTYTPDNADGLKTVSHAPTANPSSPFAKFDYTRDNNDRLATRAETVSSPAVPDNRSWTYSANGQVKTDNGALYGTDDAANLIRQTSGAVQGYDAADEMTSTSTISVVGATGAGDSTSTPQTMALPPGTTTGDLMVIAVTVPYGQTPTITGSGSFTSVGTYNAGTTASVFLYRRNVAAGEINPTISFGGFAYGKAINMVVYRGVDGINPIDGAPISAGQTGTSNVTIPSLTPAGAGDRLVLVQGAIPTTPPGSWSVPAGTTTEGSQQQPANGSAVGLISDQSLLTTAATGPRTITLSTSGALIGIALALKPRQATYGYDTRGNRVSITSVAGATTTLTYDQADRLTAFGPSATYSYDGDGTRMSKTVSGIATAFTWSDVGRLLVDGATSYLYDPSGLPLEQVAGSSVTYYHHDGSGNTRALTDAVGTILSTYTYDYFGSLTASTGTATTPFRLAGQYFDAESGLGFDSGGYYDPATGTTLNTGESADSSDIGSDCPYAKANAANSGPPVVGSCGGYHRHGYHTYIKIAEIGYQYRHEGGNLRRYDIDFNPDPAYQERMTRGRLKVYGRNPYVKKSKTSQIADVDTANHPREEGGIKGVHGKFWAVEGTKVRVTGRIDWKSRSVDHHSNWFGESWASAETVDFRCSVPVA